jgi:hypothetical protein
MPHFKSAFPSKFLSASEIEMSYDATINTVALADVGTDDKPEKKLVATFENPDHKAVVLNQTRCEAIADIAKTGDYEQWAGVRVSISKGSTRFNGKKVACITIEPPDVAF